MHVIWEEAVADAAASNTRGNAMDENLICIIDSGYIAGLPNLGADAIAGEVTVAAHEEGGICVREGAEDRIGHGTAVLDIINRHTKGAKYFIIKIFEEELSAEEELFLFALRYVCDHVPCRIVNISCGITSCNHRKELEGLCNALAKRGTVVVSAFENAGSISYPAALDMVIGVDDDLICKKHDDVVIVKNSPVNVFAYGGMQRVRWTLPAYIFVSGTSYACAHVTAIIKKSGCADIREALQYLEEVSLQTLCFEKEENGKDDRIPFCMKKAILIPYNKEIHSLVNNQDLLDFKITGIYDAAKLGNVGRSIGEFKVKDWKEIEWEADFDTVIIGHLRLLSELMKEDCMDLLLAQCRKYHKNVYAFDSLEGYAEKLVSQKSFYPRLPVYQNNHFGRLYTISVPVLGIFGTSSQQGKYTLQLALRRMLLEEGYRVGQLGTEPSALLFGMDEMLHFGYDANVNIGHQEFIERVNHLLNKMQKKDVEIILAGAQSNTVPYGITNIRYIPSLQIDFLIGLNPDRVVLCINPHDDNAYIRRTIMALEALTDCKVIALVLFPMGYLTDSVFGMKKQKITSKEAAAIKESLRESFDIPCYLLGEAEEMKELFYCVIDSFSEKAGGERYDLYGRKFVSDILC